MLKDKLRIYKSKLRSNFHNSRGWKTNRKILVIESDDWGSIRMPSKEVYEKFKAKGYDVENSLYNKYDSLASEDDLNCLFNVLSDFKDINGNPLKITANAVMANPDFKKIRDNDFKDYYYEPFTTTLEKYPKHKNCFQLWKKGIEDKLFFPQFHAREHLNVFLWMQALKSREIKTLFGFDQNTTYSGHQDYSFMDAFDFETKQELDSLKQILKEGLQLFETTLNYKSKSFIAPCYIWHPSLEKTLKDLGVEYIQGMKHQFVPTERHFKYKKVKHHLGDMNAHGQIYLTRNATFEPSSVKGMDWVDYCLSQIETSFHWKKPAIITSHRINYIGYLDEKNRDVNLKLLKELVKKVQLRWPDVEFLSSNQLGDAIKESINVK